jgi:hypothetical protein
MLRKFILAAWLFTAAFATGAQNFTDVYYTPGEGGWGTFVVQSDTFQFLAFFVYGQDGKPTWYSAYLNRDAAGNYTGELYASTGSYYAGPWDPTIQHNNPVGTASFAPSDIYHATLTYTITGLPPVQKPIERIPLTGYVLAGNYSGSMAGSISGCQDPTANDPSFRGRYTLTVTQVGDQSATLIFTFVDAIHNGIVCTLAGPITHLGRLYQLNGQSSCTGPDLSTGLNNARIDSFHPTGQGIEGHWKGSVGDGCTASLHFAAVQNVNN